MRITIIRDRGLEELSRERWVFWVSYPHVYLDIYALEDRPSRRHKSWQHVESYYRIPHDRDGFCGVQITKEPRVPRDVEEDALVTARAVLTLEMWSQRR